MMTPEEQALELDAQTNAGFYNRLPAEDAEAAFAEVEPVKIDGYLINPDTGEVVGIVEGPDPAKRFEVTDTESAEWVFEKMQTEDCEIRALNARLLALQTNMATMIADHERRRKYLEFRFGPELAEFAKDNLPKGKKTWTCPYGSVGFRATNAKLTVRDEERAIAWAKTAAPDAVKITEKFLPSKVPDGERDAMLDNPTLADVVGLGVVPGGESVTISTGVK